MTAMATINYRAWGVWAQRIGERVDVLAQESSRASVVRTSEGRKATLPSCWLTLETNEEPHDN